MVQLPPFLLNFAKDFCGPPAGSNCLGNEVSEMSPLRAAAAAALASTVTFEPPQISFHSLV